MTTSAPSLSYVTAYFRLSSGSYFRYIGCCYPDIGHNPSGAHLPHGCGASLASLLPAPNLVFQFTPIPSRIIPSPKNWASSFGMLQSRLLRPFSLTGSCHRRSLIVSPCSPAVLRLAYHASPGRGNIQRESFRWAHPEFS